MATQVTRSLVLSDQHALPPFPRVVQQILDTVEDPDANLNVLVSHVEHDPVITGHVLSMANKAASSRYSGRAIDDVFTAISLVGLSRVREVALLLSVAKLSDGTSPRRMHDFFWFHSVAVGVCGIEIAHWTQTPVSVDTALIAGLLHDIGQLWLQKFDPQRFAQAWEQSSRSGEEVVVAERALFGVDHGEIGGWLAASWGLNAEIVKAITHHHVPENAASSVLVAVIHIAEVLGNALDLTPHMPGRVTKVAASSCKALNITWAADSHRRVGRSEARSRQAASLFAI